MSGDTKSEPSTGGVPELPDLPYRELFHAVVEEMPDAVFTKDLQGRYTYINSVGARYLGLPAEQIIGRKDSELMSPQEAEHTLEFDRQTLMAGRTLHAEMSEMMAGVKREWLSTKGVMRRADGQALAGAVRDRRDLSHHRRSEEAQRRSEALFRAAASNSFDAFFILRGEETQLRLLRLNMQAEALLGLEAREAEGRVLTDFPHAVFIAPFALCEQVWGSGQTHDSELEQELPGLGRRWFRRQLDGGWGTASPSPCATSPSSASASRACGSTSAWPPWARSPPGWRTRSTTPWPSCLSNLGFLDCGAASASTAGRGAARASGWPSPGGARGRRARAAHRARAQDVLGADDERRSGWTCTRCSTRRAPGAERDPRTGRGWCATTARCPWCWATSAAGPGVPQPAGQRGPGHPRGRGDEIRLVTRLHATSRRVGSRCRTPARASRRRTSSASSIRSSPPSPWARARGWGCPSATASSGGWAACCAWTVSRARAAASGCCCRWRRRLPLDRPPHAGMLHQSVA